MSEQSVVSLPGHQDYWDLSSRTHSASTSTMSPTGALQVGAEGPASRSASRSAPSGQSPATENAVEVKAREWLIGEVRALAGLLKVIANQEQLTDTAAGWIQRVSTLIRAFQSSPDEQALANRLMWARHWLLEQEDEYNSWNAYARTLVAGDQPMRIPVRFVRDANRTSDKPIDAEAIARALDLIQG